jgi:hypothetical protein
MMVGMFDHTKAAEFMTTHARPLDRHRFALLHGTDRGLTEKALAALSAYRNPDGGYGTGLEPDFRSVTSQPVSALHAFEVFEDVAPVVSPFAATLCDWLASITLPDGGLPFALPFADTAGSAPFWSQVDPGESSPHMTAMLAGIAHRVARHDPAVRDHPWLRTATEYSLRAISRMREPGHALEFLYSLNFLDALSSDESLSELRRLGGFLPESGLMHVAGGAADEFIRPLDFAPLPGRPIRELFSPEAIEAELADLEAAQQEDGGWTVSWVSWSPAGALDWRGWSTVRATTILRAHRS